MDKLPLSIIYWSVPVSSDGSAKFTLAQEQQPVCAHPRYRPHCQHQPKQVLNLTPLLFPVLSHIIFSKQFPAGNWHCLPNTLQYLNMQLHWLLHWLLPTSKGLVNQQDCTTLPTKPFSYGLNTRWHCTPSNLKNSLWNICHEYCTIASNLNIYKDIWPLCTEVILTFEVKSYWNILCIM